MVMDQRLSDIQTQWNRRMFLGRSATGVSVAALAHLFGGQADAQASATATRGLPGLPHFAPKAKRVIYLFQSGGPSHLDLFDYKPVVVKNAGQELPDSIRAGQRLTSMTAAQARFPVVPSLFKFAQHGKSGAWISELMPHLSKVADDLTFVKSLHTAQINHDPAVTFAQTGFQLAGRPSLGAWVAYGLGAENQDLPAFVVMISLGSNDQPLYDRLWGSGFIPSKYQGVKLRSSGDPVLYISDPDGMDRSLRRRFIDDLAKLNRESEAIESRII